MPMATIHKMGAGDIYHIHFLDQRTDPGFGVGEGARPGHDLPNAPGRPDNTLPGMGGRPGQLPSGGGIPSNELPDTPPPNLAQGWTLVLIRHDNKWHYAAIAPGSPPPRPLPPSDARPDNTLPGGPVHPGNVVPGQPVIGGGPAPTPPPHVGGGPVPPQVTPQR